MYIQAQEIKKISEKVEVSEIKIMLSPNLNNKRFWNRHVIIKEERAN